MRRIASLPSTRVVHWQQPVPGAIYDDLGNPSAEPHLVRGKGFDPDPEFYQTAIDGVADRTTEDGWRMSQLNYAETLYEFPLELRYTGLDPHLHYKPFFGANAHATLYDPR